MRLLLLLLLGLSPLLSPAADPPRFQEGDYQLDVIRISGKEPGLTALVFGGIHGDEPGGYFSSELLAHIRLRRGNLIIVPRVNFPSIMLGRREVAGDMNRKFAGQVGAADPERRVVEALKRLMGEADLFVNLHDAMGFHRRKYQSKTRNPDMYGQCLIVDTGKFQSRRLSREIDLEAVGARIVAAGNALIPDAGHHFEFWNHNSIQKDTQFPEMKKSATHFALTEFSIPAFGLEASKDLPTLDLKVHYQLVMIQAILTEFGFEFDLPEIDLQPSRLSWVEFRKNDGYGLRATRLVFGDRGANLSWLGVSLDTLLWAMRMDDNDMLGCVFAREHYRRCPGLVPETVEGQAGYWKRFYNTELGKGTVEQYIGNWNRLCRPVVESVGYDKEYTTGYTKEDER
ncbi:MAG TPA: M99 family carboxypeptidase catalytic domain-containing protein [Candidatus Aminicenantes bacterium]|nr:M99 family carboxypeptidase catalytic domain-containing protein [Candidatus Aminicenantes bacterium]